jgi:hypothetical protein
MFNLKKYIMNNVDLATQKLRILQQMFYDPKNSPTDFFNYTQKEVLPLMDLASQEIRTNYAEISEKLTKQMNTGRVQE